MEEYSTHVIILFQKLSQQSCLKKNDLYNQCCFRDWIPEAKDEMLWLAKIDEYFNSCKTIDEEKDDKEEDGDETQSMYHTHAITQNLMRNKLASKIIYLFYWYYVEYC
jgi:hypothetical protein